MTAIMEPWEQFLQSECDGSGPHSMLAGNPPIAETRRMVVSGNAGASAFHLCYGCYLREIEWRRRFAAHFECPLDLPAWMELRVYATMESGVRS